MDTGHKVALVIAVIAAGGTITAALIHTGGSGRDDVSAQSSTFATEPDDSNRDCDQICRAKGARCVGATRVNGGSVGCDFRGVKIGTGFELRAKRCTCQR